MYIDNQPFLGADQLPYPSRPTGPAPAMLVGGVPTAYGEMPYVGANELPYPNYSVGDIFAPINPAFQLSAAPRFTVTSPLVPASMLTATEAEGECIAQPFYPLGDASTAYLTTPALAPVPSTSTGGTGNLRDVLEPLLLADILLGAL